MPTGVYVRAPFTAEHRAKISAALQGRAFSPDHLAKLSAAHKGQVPWNKGDTDIYSEETLAKMSAASKRRVLSPETRAKISAAGARHGHSRHTFGVRSPTYHSWQCMIQRCTNPRHQHWAYYGGRGITVCERWLVFENFLADMGERPAGKTIDRMNGSGNYEPGNCRWATQREQLRNRTVARRRRGGGVAMG